MGELPLLDERVDEIERRAIPADDENPVRRRTPVPTRRQNGEWKRGEEAEE